MAIPRELLLTSPAHSLTRYRCCSATTTSWGGSHNLLFNIPQAVLEALDKKVPSKLTFKGRLKTYRYCDNVWTLMLSDVSFKVQLSQGSTTSTEVRSDKIKVVCIDEKLLTPEDAGDGAAAGAGPS